MRRTVCDETPAHSARQSCVRLMKRKQRKRHRRTPGWTGSTAAWEIWTNPRRCLPSVDREQHSLQASGSISMDQICTSALLPPPKERARTAASSPSFDLAARHWECFVSQAGGDPEASARLSGQLVAGASSGRCR